MVHYFDDNEIEEGAKVNCNIVVSKPELSEEDKANLKETAMEQYKEEQLRELRKQSQPKATAPKHTATAPKAGAEIAEVHRCNILKNSEIHSIEGAVCSISFTAPFLHTRSFNILRRLGSGVKRKIPENQ